MAAPAPISAEPVVRSFKIPDASMLGFARVYREMFLEDAEQFAGFNPDFGGSFADDWLDAITAAESTPTDETIVDIQAQQTATVIQVMNAARRKYNQIMYFAGEAFENNIAVQNEFGKNNYMQVRTDQNAMVTFLDNLHSTCVKYSDSLTAKGCTQAQMDEIITLKQQLSAENAQQEKLIKERPTHTAERIIIHNRVYAFCQMVNRASKQVFVDNFAKIQEYLLPASENPPADIAFTGTVTKQENSEPIKDATVTIDTLSLSSTTDDFGVFAFAEEIPDGTYNFSVSAAGRQTFNGSVTISSGETVTKNVALVQVT